MNKKVRPYIIPLLISFLTSLSFAQQSINEKNIWVIRPAAEVQGKMKKLDDDISRYYQEINKCEQNISNSENIIAIAKQRGNKEAEKTANESLIKARDTKAKYLRLIETTTIKKKQFENHLKLLKEILTDNSKEVKSFNGVVTNYSGQVNILKKNGDSFELGDTQGVFLADGDIISTLDKSKVELQFLEGRGNLNVDANTKLLMKAQNDSTELVELIKGRLKISISKAQKLEQMLKDEYERLLKEIDSIPSYEKLIKRWRARMNKKFEVKSNSFALTIRGTEFIISDLNDSQTEIFIYEGTVDVWSVDGTNKVVLSSGQKLSIKKGEPFPEPINFDPEKVEKWWKQEDD